MGPLSVEQKKRAQGKRAKLEKNKEDMRKPQELREEDIARSENETSKNVLAVRLVFSFLGHHMTEPTQIFGILETFEQINLFRFIINPEDFAQSVENLFHLSFLIRDGMCSLETNDDGEPMISESSYPFHRYLATEV